MTLIEVAAKVAAQPLAVAMTALVAAAVTLKGVVSMGAPWGEDAHMADHDVAGAL